MREKRWGMREERWVERKERWVSSVEGWGKTDQVWGRRVEGLREVHGVKEKILTICCMRHLHENPSMWNTLVPTVSKCSRIIPPQECPTIFSTSPPPPVTSVNFLLEPNILSTREEEERAWELLVQSISWSSPLKKWTELFQFELLSDNSKSTFLYDVLSGKHVIFVYLFDKVKVLNLIDLCKKSLCFHFRPLAEFCQYEILLA